MTPAADAERKILKALTALPSEDCPLEAAAGRVIRQELVTDRDLPPFDKVAFDGYALKTEALLAGRKRFRIAGVQAAGMIARSLPDQECCIEVMAGAMRPYGTNAVVPAALVKRSERTIVVLHGAAVAAGDGIRQRGLDCAAGSVIQKPGRRLTGREIAIAAACGYTHLGVAMQPKIVTGRFKVYHVGRIKVYHLEDGFLIEGSG